jgi:putative transposase
LQKEKQMSLARSCRLFGVSRQSLYQAQCRAKRRQQMLAGIKPLIVAQRMKMPRLGTRKLYYLLKDELAARRLKIGRDAFHEYLRAEQLLIKPKKNYTKTTDSRHWLRKHPNLIKDLTVGSAEEVFVSDITYLKNADQTYYLALVSDVYSRKIVGYKLSADLSAESVVQALQMAIRGRQTTAPLIHHSDRGVQYCAAVYQEELRRHQIKTSMTDGGDCYQNALAERINGILKEEFLIYRCRSFEDLERLVSESIETYNQERPHLSLKMKTPNEVYRKACGQNPQAQVNH